MLNILIDSGNHPDPRGRYIGYAMIFQRFFNNRSAQSVSHHIHGGIQAKGHFPTFKNHITVDGLLVFLFGNFLRGKHLLQHIPHPFVNLLPGFNRVSLIPLGKRIIVVWPLNAACYIGTFQ